MTEPEPDEFMARLGQADRAALAARGRRRQWPAGASLYLEGESCTTVLIVVSGRVKVFSLTADGEEILLAVRGPGSLLGELSAVDGAPRSASVAALEPVVALVVPIAAFADYLRSHGDAAIVLLQLVTGRLRDADRKRVEAAAFDIPGRVARRLVELAERFGEPDGQGVRIGVALSQDELAGWVGASREAVAKALRVLRDRGFVTTGRRTMTVLDLDGLRRRGRRPRACAGGLGSAHEGVAWRGEASRYGSRCGCSIWRCRCSGCGSCSPCPSRTSCVEHHPAHFWLVALVAGVNVGLALVVDRAAQRHDDPRLLLVGLGFLAAALFFVLHALATPGVLLDSRNGGFALATPAGLALAALFTAVSALEFPPERAQRVLRVGPWLRRGSTPSPRCGASSPSPACRPCATRRSRPGSSGPLTAVAVVSVLLYVFVAVRFYLLYRRRRSVMLLSIITANILLAEAMVAVVLSVNWRLTLVAVARADGAGVRLRRLQRLRRLPARGRHLRAVRRGAHRRDRPRRSAPSTRRRWRRWSARCGGRRRGRSPRTRWA